MRETSNNQAKAAAILKITRAGLQYKLKKLGIGDPDRTEQNDAA